MDLIGIGLGICLGFLITVGIAILSAGSDRALKPLPCSSCAEKERELVNVRRGYKNALAWVATYKGRAETLEREAVTNSEQFMRTVGNLERWRNLATELQDELRHCTCDRTGKPEATAPASTHKGDAQNG